MAREIVNFLNFQTETLPAGLWASRALRRPRWTPSPPANRRRENRPRGVGRRRNRALVGLRQCDIDHTFGPLV